MNGPKTITTMALALATVLAACGQTGTGPESQLGAQPEAGNVIATVPSATDGDAATSAEDADAPTAEEAQEASAPDDAGSDADATANPDVALMMAQMDQLMTMMQGMAGMTPAGSDRDQLMDRMRSWQRQMDGMMARGQVSPDDARQMMGQMGEMMGQMGPLVGRMPPGGMMGRGPGGMMNGGPDNGMGQGMMNGGMMGGGMMGGSMMGGMMMGRTWGQPGAAPSVEEVPAVAEDYVAAFGGQGLEVAEIMTFSNHYYVQAREAAGERYAFEFLIDRQTGAVHPEPGPNMMWNTKYGHMSAWSGNPDAEPQVDAAEAVELAQAWLGQQRPGLTVDEEATPFYGYYTLHTLEDGEIAGMLSVNAFTGQVWPHTWHGAFEGMVAGEHADDEH